MTVGPAIARVVAVADEPVLLVRAVAAVTTRNLVTSGLGPATPGTSVRRRTDARSGGRGWPGPLAARIANTAVLTLCVSTQILARGHISQAGPVVT